LVTGITPAGSTGLPHGLSAGPCAGSFMWLIERNYKQKGAVHFEPPLNGCSIQDAVVKYSARLNKCTNTPEASNNDNAMFLEVKGVLLFCDYNQKGSPLGAALHERGYYEPM
jgi:hypothetical protein